jgi:glycine/D-amino acid oxidase-like deaminating enzyme
MAHDDALVIGGGIIGLSCARALLRRHPTLCLGVFELRKDPLLGAHLARRVEGWVHAGGMVPGKRFEAVRVR